MLSLPPAAVDANPVSEYHSAMSKYPFNEIEKKWQEYWDEQKTFKVTEDPSVPEENRLYVLDMFP